jgi:hypothetical protein
MTSLPADDLRKIETCWKCNILIEKLHIDVVHLVGYNKIVSVRTFHILGEIQYKWSVRSNAVEHF